MKDNEWSQVEVSVAELLLKGYNSKLPQHLRVLRSFLVTPAYLGPYLHSASPELRTKIYQAMKSSREWSPDLDSKLVICEACGPEECVFWSVHGEHFRLNCNSCKTRKGLCWDHYKVRFYGSDHVKKKVLKMKWDLAPKVFCNSCKEEQRRQQEANNRTSNHILGTSGESSRVGVKSELDRSREYVSGRLIVESDDDSGMYRVSRRGLSRSQPPPLEEVDHHAKRRRI